MADTPAVTPASPAPQYHSLYRRYRPQRFSEVRGQDLTARTLQSEVRDGRVVHSYLFSGPRGTGKTSMARILAKALNCTNSTDGEPCGECGSCLDVTRGSSLDVHELDAASNNGVDAMRDLVARAALSTPGKRKVYIIDEVHMLSTAASNALLKTLEEPPEHVVFVLATTDPQKVLPTIRSRTQHFEFHLIDEPVLESLLSEIAADAALQLPDDAIAAAAHRGHGSARDALSVLDQVVASGIVEHESAHLAEVVTGLANEEVAAVLRAVGGAIASGMDAQRLGTELVAALREQFLGSVARQAVRLEGGMLDPSGRPLLSPARAVRALEAVGKALVDMREAVEPRTTLEVALVRLANPDLDDSTAALLDRIERLERRLGDLGDERASGAPAPDRATTGDLAGPGSGSGSGPTETKPALGAFRSAPSPEPAPAATPPAAPARDDLVTAWADSILPSLKPRARALYAGGRWLAVEGDEAVFALSNAGHVEQATVVLDDVAHAISAHFGSAISLRLVPEPASGAALPPTELDPEREHVAQATEVAQTAAAARAEEAADAPSDSASWAEHRVRQAFPGIEEVTG